MVKFGFGPNEVTHTIQFRTFGIESFARMYVTHHSALEARLTLMPIRRCGSFGILAAAPVESFAVTQGARLA